MKHVIVRLVTIIALFPIFSTKATERIPEGYTVAKTIDEAISIAKQSNKKGIIVYFYLNNCRNCVLTEELLGTPQIKELYGRDFVLMSIYKRGLEEALPSKYQNLSDQDERPGLKGGMIHSMGVVDLNGKKICRQKSPFVCGASPDLKMAKKFYDEVLKILEKSPSSQEETPPACVATPTPGDC